MTRLTGRAGRAFAWFRGFMAFSVFRLGSMGALISTTPLSEIEVTWHSQMVELLSFKV